MFTSFLSSGTVTRICWLLHESAQLEVERGIYRINGLGGNRSESKRMRRVLRRDGYNDGRVWWGERCVDIGVSEGRWDEIGKEG